MKNTILVRKDYVRGTIIQFLDKSGTVHTELMRHACEAVEHFEERAARLLACWNACADLELDDIQDNGVASFSDVTELTKQIGKAQAETTALRAAVTQALRSVA